MIRRFVSVVAAALLSGVPRVSADIIAPTNVVANTYHSPDNARSLCFGIVTDGMVSAADADCFDTYPGSGHPDQFAGLLYLEQPGSTAATRFDSIRIDIGTAFPDGGDFAATPRLYLLKHNSDPNTSDPVGDERYVELSVVPTKATNSAARPYYTFDLSTLPAGERTGYGFAVVGPGSGSTRFISVAEISAAAVRIPEGAPIPPVQPRFITYNGHQYALTFTRGSWEQLEAEAITYGGHLAAINDAAENEFLGRAFGRQESLAIGLRQSSTAGEPSSDFGWSNGDPLTFTNWHDGEPNNSSADDEDYVFINYWQDATGTWGDTRPAGYPETANYRGIIELPTAGDGLNFQQLIVNGRANIFGAGHSSSSPAPQGFTGSAAAPASGWGGGGGGIPANSAPVSGGSLITFDSVTGSVQTGADLTPADGPGHPSHVCDITGVGGISGYLNNSDGPGLLGVFLSDAEPVHGQEPARLDFSNNALGRDFATLSPAIGQVFFVGDGRRADGTPQTFVAPPTATRLFLGIPDAYQGDGTRIYTGAPNGYNDNSGYFIARFQITPSEIPIIATGDFPVNGGTLSVAGGSGGNTFILASGNLPAGLSLSANGTISGTALNGTYSFTIRVTDSQGHSSERNYTVTIANASAVAQGIIGWWPGENAVGDIIGGRHGLAQLGEVAYGTGKVGRAFVFDGSQKHVSVPNAAALNLSGNMAIEAWIKPTANAQNEPAIVGKRDGDNANVSYSLFLKNDNRLAFSSRNAGGSFAEVISADPLPLNQWSHVAVSISGSILKLYVNGQIANSNAGYPVRPDSSGPVTIGATLTNGPAVTGEFSGLIDELTFYNRPLDENQIAAIYSSGTGGKQRFDVSRDFSLTTNNASSVWQYGSFADATAPFSRYPGPPLGGVATLYGWSPSAGLPVVAYNNSDDTVGFTGAGGTEIRYPGRQVGLHPSSGRNRSVVRWTAPTAGVYAVSATFNGLDVRPTTTDVAILRGATELFKGSVGSFLGDGVSHTGTFRAQANDTVDFVIGDGFNGDSYDSTGLYASIVYLGPALTIDQTAFPTAGGTLTASGGTGPYKFSVEGGAENLPPGLSLSADGVVSGTVTAPGRYTFNILVTDQNGQGTTASQTFTVVIAEETDAPEGLVEWYPGELHVQDVASGKVGQPLGVDNYGPGKVGRAFHFDGADDSTQVNSPALNHLPLTIEAWVKPEVRTDAGPDDFLPNTVVSNDRYGQAGHGFGLNVFPNGSSLWLELQGNDATFHKVPGVSFNAGQWYHIAIVLTPGNAKTYVNGELKDDLNFTQGALDGDDILRIGRHNDDSSYGSRRFFKGSIDELSIYHRALSTDEILAIYDADSLGKTRDDAARDFSSVENTATSRWQYGSLQPGATPSVGTFTRYSELVSESTIKAWRAPGTIDPNVIKNIGEQAYLHWAPEQLSAHPGPNGHYSVVRWTAPAPGKYAVACYFSRLNTQNGSSSLHVRHKTATLFDDIITDAGSQMPFFAKIDAFAGDTVDFIVGPSGPFDFDATGLTPSIALLDSAAPIAPPTGLKITTSDPARTLQSFAFSALHANNVQGLKLRVQYTTTPDNEGSWQDLAVKNNSNAMTLVQGTNEWRLTANPIPLQPGDYYFRVIASAPGLQDGISAVFGANALSGADSEASGPLTIAPAPTVTPATELKIELVKGKKTVATTSGKESDTWKVTVKQDGNNELASLGVRIQYTTDPSNPDSWENVSGGKLKRTSVGAIVWEGTLEELPPGQLYFRVLTSATGYYSANSSPSAAYTIDPSPVLKWTYTVETPGDSSGATVKKDETITYKIRLKNVGSAPAEDLRFETRIPNETVYNGSPDEGKAGYLEKQPKGASDSKVTMLRWQYGKAIGNLAPGATATGTFNVKPARSLNVHSYAIARFLRFNYSGVSETVDLELKTEVVEPVRAKLTSNKSIAALGEDIEYTLVITNDYDSITVTSVSALVNVPRGTTLVSMNTTKGDGNFTDVPLTNPAPDSTPSASRYYFGVDRILRWNVGSIPPRSQRRIKYTVRVQHDLPTSEVDSKGVFHTTEITTLGYNVTYTPPSGGKLDVFKLSAPAHKVLVSGEELVSPPILKLEKTSIGDGLIQNDPSWNGTVTAIREDQSIVYKLHFSNYGHTAARRVQIQERLGGIVTKNGRDLTFQGFCKISRNGGPEQELPFNSFRFYDSKGKLVSGEPFIDLNNNGVRDSTEPFTDLTEDGVYTPQGDIRNAEILVFDLGDLDPGTDGYVRYQCAATAPVGTLIRSDNYVLVSESLRGMISGSPAATFARVVPDLSFQIDTKPSKSAVAPNDIPDDPATSQDERDASRVRFEIAYRNTSFLNAPSVPVEFEIPEGLQLDGELKLFGGTGALEAYRIDETVTPAKSIATPSVSVELKGRKLTFRPEIKAQQSGKMLVRCIMLPSSELPRSLQRIGSFVTAKAKIPALKFTRQPVRIARDGTREPLAASAQASTKEVSNESGLAVLATNRPHLYGVRVAPLSQETGNNLIYLLVAGNSGNTAVKNAKMGFFIPPGTEFVEATSPSKRKGDILTFSLGDIPAGGAVGVAVTVNVKYVKSGTVQQSSFTVSSDNTWKLDFLNAATTIRDRNFFAMLGEIFMKPFAALGAALNGSGSAQFQNDLNMLKEDSLFIQTLGATLIPGHETRLRVVALGSGQVLTIAPIGQVSGGTMIAGGHNSEIRAGTGAQMNASSVGTLNGQKLIQMVRQAQQGYKYNVFTGGSGRLISHSGDQLLDNDSNLPVDSILARAGDLVAAGGGNLVAAGGGNLVAAGGLNLVAAGGGNLVAAGGGNLVAAGGLNLVAAGGGNVIAVSGGDLVAAGGLNLVAAGGGNLVAAGGGNLVAAGGLNLVAAGGLNLIGSKGNTLVGNDGASLVGPDGGTLVGLDGGSLIGVDAGSLIGQDGGSLVGQDGGTLVGPDGGS